MFFIKPGGIMQKKIMIQFFIFCNFILFLTLNKVQAGVTFSASSNPGVNLQVNVGVFQIYRCATGDVRIYQGTNPAVHSCKLITQAVPPKRCK